MPIPGDFRRPDLFIVESGSSPRIAPAVTSVGGVVGVSRRGRTDKAYLVSNWSDYLKIYGGFTDLPKAHYNGTLAVYFHFLNGGGPLYFTRVAGAGAVSARLEANDTTTLQQHETVGANANEDALNVYANAVGTWGNTLSVKSEIYSHTVSAVKVNDADHQVVKISSLVDVAVGDVLDAYTEAGAFFGYAVVGGIIANPSNYASRLGADADGTWLVLGARTANDGAGFADATNYTVRSSSQHRASTRLTKAYADNDTTLTLASTTGISVGSMLTVVLASINDLDAAKDVHLEGHGVVTAVSNNTVTLAAELATAAGAALNAAIATDVKAWTNLLNFSGDANEGLAFLSVLSGSDGNSVSVEIKSAVAEADLPVGVTFDANGVAVVVTGHDIVIYAEAANQPKLAEVKARYDLTAAATALATLTVVGDSDQTLIAADDDKAKTYLTGGAYAAVVSQEFQLQVLEGADIVETHDYLTVSASNADYVDSRLGGTVTATSTKPDDSNQSWRLIAKRDATDVPSSLLEPGNLYLKHFPKTIPETLLAGGVDADTPNDIEMVGSEVQGSETGIYTFQNISDLDFMAVPGASSSYVAQKLSALAESMKVIGLMDTPQSDTTFDNVVNFINGELNVDSHHLAIYGSWVKVQDPRDLDRTVEVPPTAFAISDYAVIASTKGVHYTPANRPLRGPIELVTEYTEAQRDVLNDIGVNPLRHIRGSGFRIFGGRTRYSAGDSRKFVAVRRWVNYFERSMLNSLGDLILQPANKQLMNQLVMIVDQFLDFEWRKGALYPDNVKTQAYSVKCDSETTTAADLAAGTINCEIVVSPVTPAEHIVFGLSIEAGGISINEIAA